MSYAEAYYPREYPGRFRHVRILVLYKFLLKIYRNIITYISICQIQKANPANPAPLL